MSLHRYFYLIRTTMTLTIEQVIVGFYSLDLRSIYVYNAILQCS